MIYNIVIIRFIISYLFDLFNCLEANAIQTFFIEPQANDQNLDLANSQNIPANIEPAFDRNLALANDIIERPASNPNQQTPADVEIHVFIRNHFQNAVNLNAIANVVENIPADDLRYLEQRNVILNAPGDVEIDILIPDFDPRLR